jgi:hypothetical protein
MCPSILHLQGKGRNNNYDPYYSSGYVVYGKGKGKGNGYGYYGKDKGGYTADDDAPAPTAAPTIETADAGPTAAPAESNPACVQVAFQEEFLFLSADLAIPPSSTDPNEIGTTFIYEPSPLFNDTEFTQNGASVEIPGSQVTGVCTRTLEPLNGVGGGGICQFTIILSEGSSITFGGFIEDFVAGNAPPTLVISGGSNIDTGITGEVALLPLDGNGDAFTGDIFFDAFGYQAFVSAMILVCEVIDGF